MAAAQLFEQFCSGEKNQAGMSVRMIANDVAALGDFAGELGKSANVFSGEEKCAARAVAFEQIEQCGRDGRIGTIVEGEREA